MSFQIWILYNLYYLVFLTNKATIGLILKRRLEYKSSYITWNERLNYVMLVLHGLLDTPLYKNIEVYIHPQWNNMFALS